MYVTCHSLLKGYIVVNKLFKTTLLALTLTAGLTSVAQAVEVTEVPAPAQDPIVQHLKLSDDQVAKIKALHQQFENSASGLQLEGFKDGALTDMFHSGKWDDAAVKKQLAAFSQYDQQLRYYRVKYYFDINQILTPEQRKQVKTDILNALN